MAKWNDGKRVWYAASSVFYDAKNLVIDFMMNKKITTDMCAFGTNYINPKGGYEDPKQGATVLKLFKRLHDKRTENKKLPATEKLPTATKAAPTPIATKAAPPQTKKAPSRRKKTMKEIREHRSGRRGIAKSGIEKSPNELNIAEKQPNHIQRIEKSPNELNIVEKITDHIHDGNEEKSPDPINCENEEHKEEAELVFENESNPEDSDNEDENHDPISTDCDIVAKIDQENLPNDSENQPNQDVLVPDSTEDVNETHALMVDPVTTLQEESK